MIAIPTRHQRHDRDPGGLSSGRIGVSADGRPHRDTVTYMVKMPGELSELLEADVTPYAEDLSADVHELYRAIDRLDDGHRERVEELERRQAS
jgi:hypothetical protein